MTFGFQSSRWLRKFWQSSFGFQDEFGLEERHARNGLHMCGRHVTVGFQTAGGPEKSGRQALRGFHGWGGRKKSPAAIRFWVSDECWPGEIHALDGFQRSLGRQQGSDGFQPAHESGQQTFCGFQTAPGSEKLEEHCGSGLQTRRGRPKLKQQHAPIGFQAATGRKKSPAAGPGWVSPGLWPRKNRRQRSGGVQELGGPEKRPGLIGFQSLLGSQKLQWHLTVDERHEDRGFQMKTGRQDDERHAVRGFQDGCG